MNSNQRKPIYVTRPSLPPLDEFVESLKEIWDSRILTNFGPFHDRLEKELAEYLGVKYVSLFANGTLALITALQTLDITGEVITTPFSFVATTNSLIFRNITPVFVDIEPDYFNLDADKIEAAITSKTQAILPVHVFGNPCNVEGIQQIANRNGMKVIYDSAHAYGVAVNGTSVLNFGDLSILSFHATKVYNTFEGGAIVCHDYQIKKRIDHLKDFGFTDEINVIAPGINGKMNELQSAYGLLQLKYINGEIKKRQIISNLYGELLNNISGVRVLQDMPGVRHNYSYFPILIDQKVYGKSRDEVYAELKRHNIFSRRYFYPLISQYPSYNRFQSARAENLPVAEIVTQNILCLPLYSDLERSEVELVTKIISDFGTY